MKVRNGFVSNSSSSSFVLDTAMTTAQVATMMMYEIKRDWLNWADSCDDDPSFESFEAALRWLEDNQDYDKPIIFPWSTNYETFIWKNDSGVCVDTCNNHNWNILSPNYCDGDHYYRLQDDTYPLDEWDEKFYVGGRDEYFDLSRMKLMTRSEFVDLERERWRSYNENS